MLYAILVTGMGFCTLLLLSEFSPPGRGSISFRNEFLHQSAGFVVVYGAALLMARIERRPLGVYGLPLESAFRGLFWQGCLFGLIEISTVIGLVALFGGYSFGTLALHGADIFRWGFAWMIFFLFVGLFEEFLFRGYTQSTIAEGIGFWPAAMVLSISFGATHYQNFGENNIGVGSVVLAGLFWCFTLRRTGSLWFAVGMHAAFDFGESFLYSVPDSGVLLPGHLSNAVLRGPAWLTGGSPGPEASVFDFLLLVIFFLIVHRLYPPRRAEDSRRQTAL
jgi:membrane protease YdiL (CAAX protease family)